MPGLVALVSAISADVVAKLATAGLSLTDGQIVLGRVHVDENSAPNRIIFVPKSSRFEAPERQNRSNVDPRTPTAPGAGLRSVTVTTYGSGYTGAPTVTISAPDIAGGVQATATAVVTGDAVSKVVLTAAGSGYLNPPTVSFSGGGGTGAAATANLGLSAEKLSLISTRPIRTEIVTFEVNCWGASSPSDPNTDFDVTQALYQQVIASTWLLAAGVSDFGPLSWLDARDNSTQIALFGHWAVFTLTLRTPVLDQPLLFAPVGVQPNPTTQIQPFAGGATEVGCTG